MSTRGEERPLRMNRAQIEAWLAIEGHYLSRNSLFFYCIAYGREWTRYADYAAYEEDTWNDHGQAGDHYASGNQRIVSWDVVPYPALKQLYNTLVDYKENPT